MRRDTFERQAKALGVTVEVDRLRAGEVHIDITSPEGQRFSGTGGHTLVTHYYTNPEIAFEDAMSDLLNNLPLEACDEECEE